MSKKSAFYPHIVIFLLNAIVTALLAYYLYLILGDQIERAEQRCQDYNHDQNALKGIQAILRSSARGVEVNDHSPNAPNVIDLSHRTEPTRK